MNQKIINNERVVVNKKGRGTIIVSALLLLTIFAVAANYMAVKNVSAATSPSLGTATSFAVLAYSKVANTGPTVVTGDLGLSPTTGAAITGFPPGTVIGKIYAVDSAGPAGLAGNNPGLLTTAKTDLSNAYTNLANQPCTTSYGHISYELGGKSLGPGVYCADAFTLTGTLTLTGSGVWIFQALYTLTTVNPGKVVGGDPCNVWWQLGSSATVGTGTELTGSILAYAAITLANGASLNGRALAENSFVTLDSNQVSAACVVTLTTTVSGTLTTMTVTGIVSVINGQTVVAIVSGNTLVVIPEYPLGVLLLLILMLPVYMLLKRGNQNSISKRRSQ